MQALKRGGIYAVVGGLIEAGELRTVIDRRYSLEQIAEAHRYAEAWHKKGHVVILPAQTQQSAVGGASSASAPAAGKPAYPDLRDRRPVPVPRSPPAPVRPPARPRSAQARTPAAAGVRAVR